MQNMNCKSRYLSAKSINLLTFQKTSSDSSIKNIVSELCVSGVVSCTLYTFFWPTTVHYLCLYTASAFSGSIYFLRASPKLSCSETLQSICITKKESNKRGVPHETAFDGKNYNDIQANLESIIYITYKVHDIRCFESKTHL